MNKCGFNALAFLFASLAVANNKIFAIEERVISLIIVIIAKNRKEYVRIKPRVYACIYYYYVCVCVNATAQMTGLILTKIDTNPL